MPLLSFTRQLDSAGVVRRLEQEFFELKSGSIAFFEIDFDEAIAQALVKLLRLNAEKGRRLGEFDLFLCPGSDHITKVLQVTLKLDLFSKLYIQGSRDPEYRQPSLEVFEELHPQLSDVWSFEIGI